ncbi:MAG: hypothetical protein V7752_01340 [Halopseudomonas sp.]
MSPRAILLSAVGFIALIGISIGGYFLFLEVEEVHKQNVEDLAGFGSKVVPISSREGGSGVTFGMTDGTIQLPPSIQEKKLSPTEKVILSLSRDKDELQYEVAKFKQQIDEQQQRLIELRAYKAENERFAPDQLNQERQRAEEMLKEYFDNSSDVTRFSKFQQQAMNLATANIYTEVVRQHQLMLNDEMKDEMVKILPQFGLCLGEGLPFITNNRAEEVFIIKALSNGNLSEIKGGLAEDFNAIHGPCLKQLNRQVNRLLSQQSNQQHAAISINLTGNSASSADSNLDAPPGPDIDPSMSPTEQLIQSLSYDKKMMLAKANRMKQQLDQQIQELAELKGYHDQTERYAPLPALEERDRAQAILIDYLEETRDAKRFNSFEKQAMSFAAANHYAAFSKRHQLVLNEALKDQIIENHLPSFGFCFGDGLKFAIDNRLQERQLINALREQDSEYVDSSLAQQIDTITLPCAEQLDRKLQAYL